MVTPRDRTPVIGLLPPDPDQLTLGGLDPGAAAPAPVRDTVVTQPADEGQVAVREPPVCGEWSFDLDETPDARAGATFVPTPTFSQKPIPAPKPDPRRSSDAGAPSIFAACGFR